MLAQPRSHTSSRTASGIWGKSKAARSKRTRHRHQTRTTQERRAVSHSTPRLGSTKTRAACSDCLRHACSARCSHCSAPRESVPLYLSHAPAPAPASRTMHHAPRTLSARPWTVQSQLDGAKKERKRERLKEREDLRALTAIARILSQCTHTHTHHTLSVFLSRSAGVGCGCLNSKGGCERGTARTCSLWHAGSPSGTPPCR